MPDDERRCFCIFGRLLEPCHNCGEDCGHETFYWPVMYSDDPQINNPHVFKFMMEWSLQQLQDDLGVQGKVELWGRMVRCA